MKYNGLEMCRLRGEEEFKLIILLKIVRIEKRDAAMNLKLIIINL